MKNLTALVLLVISTLFLASCAKTPFKEEKPLANSALVYVYAVEGEVDNDSFKIPYYELKINSKSVDGKIYPYEFLKYNLDADSVVIDAIRNDIEKKTIELDLTRGEAHYLRIKNNGTGFANFEFEVVPNKEALDEIRDTKYAIAEESDMLDIILTKEDAEKNEAEVSSATAVEKSKTQKIKEAHKLKEDGIITDQEFKKLKAEILDAD